MACGRKAMAGDSWLCPPGQGEKRRAREHRLVALGRPGSISSLPKPPPVWNLALKLRNLSSSGQWLLPFSQGTRAPGRALFLSTGDTLPPLISNAAVVRLVGWSPRQKAGRQQLTQGGPPTPHLPPPAAQLLAPKLRPESVSPFQPQRCFLLALGAASLRAGIALTVYNTCTHSPSHTHTQLRGV